jgi:hypothetical protein
MSMPPPAALSARSRISVRYALAFAAPALIALWAVSSATAQAPAEIDTALVLAVDVSDSVDEARYRLQMEGIARAIEDPAVVNAITSGAKGAIMLSLVAWADDAKLAMPWQLIRNQSDAFEVARRVRSLPHHSGQYTCLARMLRSVESETMPALPARADRVVIDVSGDGIDNCEVSAASNTARDTLVKGGATLNGLPIIVAGENDVVGAGTFRRPGFAFEDLGLDRDSTTLDAWYNAHVVGGPGSFISPADGYEDFGRSFRRKFITEISAPASTPLHLTPSARRALSAASNRDDMKSHSPATGIEASATAASGSPIAFVSPLNTAPDSASPPR